MEVIALLMRICLLLQTYHVIASPTESIPSTTPPTPTPTTTRDQYQCIDRHPIRLTFELGLPDRKVHFDKGTSIRLLLTTELRNCRENVTRIFVYVRGQDDAFDKCSWTATTNTCEVSCDLTVTRLQYGTSVYVSAFVGSALIETPFLNLYCSQKDGSKCLSTDCSSTPTPQGKTNEGRIVGGSLGTLAGIILIAAVIYYRRWHLA